MPDPNETRSRLDEALVVYRRLEETRIRSEGDVARAQAEYDRTRLAAEERFGTDDPEEIERIIQRREEKDREAVEEFDRTVRTIASELAAIERRR